MLNKARVASLGLFKDNVYTNRINKEKVLNQVPGLPKIRSNYAGLWHPWIARQSYGIHQPNTLVRALTFGVRTPCVSCSSLACLAAELRPKKIAQESQRNKHVENLVFVVVAA